MKIKALEICGPGFFWAWCYCLWFVPNLYGESAVTAPGESESWLFVLFSAAIVQFIVPLCLRKRHLSAFPFLYAIAPLLVFGGTLLIELSRISSINGLYLSGSIVSGASSAFLWHLWGDYYASTRNDNGEGIAFGFGLTLLASIAITSFTPPVVSCIFVAVTPLLSGGMLIALKRMRNHADYPPHPPAACRKTSRLAILKICTIAFIACSIGTYSWASIDTSLLPIGHNAIPLGVATGAFFMIVAALPKYLLHEKMQTGKIFSWMLFLCILGIALSLIGSKEIATASYIVSMAATVAFDVLLATYFISLVVKGYVTSTTAFGYSEGCICAAMLVGNTSVEFEGNIAAPYCARMFADCPDLASADLSNLDTSAALNMRDMFSRCSSLGSLDLSSFDTSAAQGMSGMFYDCSSLGSLDLSGFDTSEFRNMNSMFRNCASLEKLDLSDFETSAVRDAFYMFWNCSSLRSLNLSSFDTSRIADMHGMFGCCSSLASLDLSSFDTSTVSDMAQMFFGCSSIESLDLSNFNTSEAREMTSMFDSCSSLKSLDLSSFNTFGVSNMAFMFLGCSSLKTLNLSGFDTSKTTSMSYMFEGCDRLESVFLGEGFSVEGALGRRLCNLPAIDKSHVPGADGLWRNGAGEAFAPEEIPSGVAATYRSDGPRKPQPPSFLDVGEETPHIENINWLASSGVAKGFPDGTFRPYATVARCDMAAFLYRLAGEPSFEPSAQDMQRFPDVDPSTPHAKEIWWLAASGITGNVKFFAHFES